MKGESGTKLSQGARSTQGILGPLLVLCSSLRENYSHSILQRRLSEDQGEVVSRNLKVILRQ